MTQHHTSKQGLSFVFWLNLSFSIIELIGGILTNSTAIMTDALHDFTDALAIGLAIKLEKVAHKKADSVFSYGYKRFSLLSALGLSVFLFVGAILMIVNAIESFFHPKEIHSVGMLGLAVIGIIINGLGFLKIRNGGHHHHHHHCHEHNHNHKAIMLHLLEDVLGWVTVLLGAVVMYFTNWFWIDGVLTLGIGLFIVYNATKNSMDVLKIMLQSVPKHMDIEQLKTQILSIPNVVEIQDLHIWSLDGKYTIGTVKLSMKIQASENVIFSSVEKLMREYQIQDITIQIQPKNQIESQTKTAEKNP